MQLYLSANFTFEKLQQKLKDCNSYFYIADYERKAGYVKLRIGEEPVKLRGKKHIEIERIYVLSEFQGKKAVKELMGASIRLASQKGYQVLWLGVWEHNHKAIQFYQQWGLEIVGSHGFLLGAGLQSDFLMKLEL